MPNQIVREYTHAFVAVSPHNGGMDSLILPQANEHTMSIFLQEVSNRHPNDFILMVMDGAGWHRAKALRVPNNMALIFLPPYSPELNPAEKVWWLIKRHMNRKVHLTMQHLQGDLDKTIQEQLTIKRIKSLTSYNLYLSAYRTNL